MGVVPAAAAADDEPTLAANIQHERAKVATENVVAFAQAGH